MQAKMVLLQGKINWTQYVMEMDALTLFLWANGNIGPHPTQCYIWHHSCVNHRQGFQFTHIKIQVSQKIVFLTVPDEKY